MGKGREWKGALFFCPRALSRRRRPLSTSVPRPARTRTPTLTPLTHPPAPTQFTLYTLLVCLVAASGGLLFGCV